MYFYFSVGMYIITVLPHSDSFLYWRLAYIREGISDLRIYVAMTSPCPRKRGVTHPPFHITVTAVGEKRKKKKPKKGNFTVQLNSFMYLIIN